MAHIQLLDQITIDKIAAGEVIERPASIVKELVENAIDAKATAVVVEIKEGGISFIRITDNGCGIDRNDVPAAFLRHSTSKIRSVEDLTGITSLGFRGEALSSIAAVAQVELITKTQDDVFGTRYVIEGGHEKSLEETGAPDGTTFLIHQIFYNTPARRKFLRTPMTEASHISDLLIKLALSHPDVSFQFINNGQTKLHTSGNGNLKDVIYHIYGREIANNLIPVSFEKQGLKITGFLGKPLISRGNRNFETYFINGRYVKSNIISKGIEDAYKDFTMQHKYPFVVLHFEIDGEQIDVNVHPTKMELRFSNQQEIYNQIYEVVHGGLQERELIPKVELPEPKLPEAKPVQQKPIKPKSEPVKPTVQSSTEPAMAQEPKAAAAVSSRPQVPTQPPKEEDKKLDYFMNKMRERVNAYHSQHSAAEVQSKTEVHKPSEQMDRIKEAARYAAKAKTTAENKVTTTPVPVKVVEPKPEPPKQLDLFEEKLLSKERKAEYKLIGQVFGTYWLVEFQENLYIIDQHAAHERVLYERTLKGMKTREFTSQYLSPPIILNLTMPEAELLERYIDQFTRIGFEIESFGSESYAVRAVPDNLFSIAKKELLMEMIDHLSENVSSSLAPDILDEKIASMSCKAAVKGNSSLSAREVEVLIGELLTLDNPYHCPHGRPTIIAMSKRELEKKFKRII